MFLCINWMRMKWTLDSPSRLASRSTWLGYWTRVKWMRMRMREEEEPFPWEEDELLKVRWTREMATIRVSFLFLVRFSFLHLLSFVRCVDVVGRKTVSCLSSSSLSLFRLSLSCLLFLYSLQARRTLDQTRTMIVDYNLERKRDMNVWLCVSHDWGCSGNY